MKRSSIIRIRPALEEDTLHSFWQLQPELVDNAGKYLANIGRSILIMLRDQGLHFTYQRSLEDALILKYGNFFEVFGAVIVLIMDHAI